MITVSYSSKDGVRTHYNVFSPYDEDFIKLLEANGYSVQKEEAK